MSHRPIGITVLLDSAPWHRAIVRAVTEVTAKGSPGYTVEECVTTLEKRIQDGQTIVLMAYDESTGKDVFESECGMCVIDFILDFLGSKVALLTYGWIDSDYGKQDFEAAWPMIQAIAKEQQCREIWFFTLRNPEAFARWMPDGFEHTYSVLTKKVQHDA